MYSCLHLQHLLQNVWGIVLLKNARFSLKKTWRWKNIGINEHHTLGLINEMVSHVFIQADSDSDSQTQMSNYFILSQYNYKIITK